MKIPRVLKVGGHYITVTQTEQMVDDADGSWLASDNTIKLKKQLPPTQKEVTLIHEILHCINVSVKEIEIEYLAQALYQVILDNKLVFDGKEPE